MFQAALSIAEGFLAACATVFLAGFAGEPLYRGGKKVRNTAAASMADCIVDKP